MIFIIALIICGLALIMCVFGFIGVEKNFEIRMDLINAIHRYKTKYIHTDEWEKIWLINYDDLYDFNIIQDCFPWLWKHEKHLPPEKYEIIKPFLSKKK